MPSLIDIAFLTLVTVVATVVETFVFFPRFRDEVASGVPGARRRGYRRAIIGQWLFAAACIGLWARAGRSWNDLGFVPPMGWRMVAGVALGAVMLYFAVRQVRALRRVTPEKLEAIRPKFAGIEFILPHDRSEYRWFTFLSFTAGFCEELLYRGYLIWVLKAYVGVAGAIVAGVVLFGVGHAYQGWRGVVKTALAGLAMSLVFVGSGWLIPGMVLHALIDASAGAVAFRVFSQPASSAPPGFSPLVAS